MADTSSPLVSIGVPVFNGEQSLARALDSLLRQDYPRLEIIISDNGSTDATRAICENFAAKDSRVRYYRSEQNRGPIWNFNRVFELSSGEYFLWAAHDDVREPSCVRVCVEKLSESPNAVLCQTHTAMFIEGRTELLGVANLNSFEGLHGLYERYKETLCHFPATAIYGVYRSSAVRKTKLFQKCMATDVAFIQELSIYGDFVQVPELLFRYIGRSKWNTVDQDFLFVFGKPKKPWWYLPFLALFWNHCARVASAEIPRVSKLRLLAILAKYEAAQVTLKVALKATARIWPKSSKESVGRSLYMRWILSPNVVVGNESLFLERVVKPTLGWWSV
jgi:glycosyltransferase involved in cell wall biosynthesis